MQNKGYSISKDAKGHIHVRLDAGVRATVARGKDAKPKPKDCGCQHEKDASASQYYENWQAAELALKRAKTGSAEETNAREAIRTNKELFRLASKAGK